MAWESGPLEGGSAASWLEVRLPFWQKLGVPVIDVRRYVETIRYTGATQRGLALTIDEFELLMAMAADVRAALYAALAAGEPARGVPAIESTPLTAAVYARTALEARQRCLAGRAELREALGPEPDGAWLRIRLVEDPARPGRVAPRLTCDVDPTKALAVEYRARCLAVAAPGGP